MPQPRRKNKIYRRAARDIKLTNRPARRQVKRDYAQALRGTESAYGGFNQYMEDMPEYSNQDIAGNLTQNLQGIQEMLSGYGNMPTGEVGAAANLFGNLGSVGMQELASQEARNQAYGTSALREGALAERAARSNLIDQRLGDLRDLRADPALIRQRVDELRRQALENRVVRSQIESDEAFRRFLMDQIGATLEDLGPRNRSRRRRTNNGRGQNGQGVGIRP